MAVFLRDAERSGARIDVLIDGDRIVAIGPGLVPPDEAELIDGRGSLVSPAFVDLQLNGAFGHDLVESPESVWEIARRLPERGVGSFLPTIISSAPGTIEAMIRVLEAGPPAGFAGALPLGIHLEGPCLAPARRGAHEERFLRAARERPEAMLHPLVKMVTLAPELDGALALVAELAGRGLVVSAGHSDAGPDEVAVAKSAGLRAGTHLYNAMSGLHHREPGLAAALLDDADLFCGLVADGVHADPLMVRLALRLKGPDRLFLVSDAMAGAGCAPGRYRLAGQDVVVDETAVRLADGRLAGSSALLDRCLRGMRAATGLPLADLLPLVTSTPAALLGLDAAVRPGARADLVLLDEEGRVRLTILAGEIRHRR